MSDKKQTKEQRERAARARKVFTDLAAAQAADPQVPGYQLTPITRPDGSKVWTWAPHKEGALLTIARADGYRADYPGTGPNKDRLAEQLARLSPEDQAILIARFAPPPAATDGQGAGKGGKKGGGK